jgi:hypothetical protein
VEVVKLNLIIQPLDVPFWEIVIQLAQPAMFVKLLHVYSTQQQAFQVVYILKQFAMIKRIAQLIPVM